MVWRRPSDKPLSEQMIVSLLTHIYVIWSQWMNSLPASPRVFCNIGYPSKMHLMLKSHEMFLSVTYFSVVKTFKKFAQCTAKYHCRALCNTSKRSTIGMVVKEEIYLAIFEFRMRFRLKMCILQQPVFFVSFQDNATQCLQLSPPWSRTLFYPWLYIFRGPFTKMDK